MNESDIPGYVKEAFKDSQFGAGGGTRFPGHAGAVEQQMP